MTHIDDMNLARDIRVRDAGKSKAPTITILACAICHTPGESCDCANYRSYELDIDLPVKWIVCPTCNGKGKHVTPGVDAGGISAEDFHDDPDFADAYMRGDYDVTCSRCDGRTTVQVADRDAMNPVTRGIYDAHMRDLAADESEILAEIRAGC